MLRMFSGLADKRLVADWLFPDHKSVVGDGRIVPDWQPGAVLNVKTQGVRRSDLDLGFVSGLLQFLLSYNERIINRAGLYQGLAIDRRCDQMNLRIRRIQQNDA